MTKDQVHQTAPISAPHDQERWAELADLVLIISREIQFRRYTDERAVHLSQSEGMVMRYLARNPAAPPSRIADATGLQRTNLSATLRGLEEKGFIERRAQSDDGRGVRVHSTERGRTNTTLVRQEWSATLSEAAHHDSEHLDAAIALLASVEAGLTRTRPQTRSKRPAPES